MTSGVVEQRLRYFLLIVSGTICVGTIAELLLTKHTQTPVQFIPYALCGLGVVAVGAALLFPQRATLFGLRIVMVIVTCGSLFGIYEHLQNNWQFAMEITPGAPLGEVIIATLKGANPLLAPGILALAASLALAATYYHPALHKPTT